MTHTAVCVQTTARQRLKEEKEMKTIYKTPEIKVEELLKRDVLCASVVMPDKVDNYTLLDSIWEGLGDILGS